MSTVFTKVRIKHFVDKLALEGNSWVIRIFRGNCIGDDGNGGETGVLKLGDDIEEAQ